MQAVIDIVRLSLVGVLFFLTVPRQPQPVPARARR